MSFAVIETGGKQYRAELGQKLRIDKLPASATPKAGDKVVFDRVLLVSKDGAVTIGAPYVPGAKVEAELAREGRGKKTIVFKYHSKTRYRKKAGHRAHYAEVEIKNIK